jgi:hypothetical protein
MSNPIIPVLAALAAVAALAWLYRRLAASRVQFEALPEGWEQIDPARYAPLSRLLAPEDFAFLRTLPGYEPKLERSLRRRRLDAFQQFLAALTGDFGTLQRVGHLMIASGHASPMLREQLLLSKIAFTRALWQVRVEMLLFRFGGRGVDTARLLSAMRDACGALQLSPGESAA